MKNEEKKEVDLLNKNTDEKENKKDFMFYVAVVFHVVVFSLFVFYQNTTGLYNL